MFKDNLRNLLYSEKINVPNLSQLVDIKTGTIHSWFNEGKEPKYETLIQIKNLYRQNSKMNKNINLDWLISGEGEMFIEEFNEEKGMQAAQKLLDTLGAKWKNGVLVQK